MQTVVNERGFLFENELTEHIFSLNIELMNLLMKQTDAFSHFNNLLSNLQLSKFPLKEQNRINAVRSKTEKILENINEFQIHLSGLTYPNKIFMENDARGQFEALTKFLTEQIESDEENDQN
jgi:hypothetical protein